MKYLYTFLLQCLHLQASLAQCPDEDEMVHRDVVIIGGGSSGTYSAVRLQQMGKSVALIEKQNVLGGNTETYKDEASGKTFDYGVKILINTTTVHNFFDSLDTPLAPVNAVTPGGPVVAVDIKRGELGPEWPVVNSNDSAAALERYKVQLAKYSPEFFRGYNLPDPVPEDLLIPWGDFLKKYDLGALGYDGFLQFQGMGNILAQPTLYMMKLFNPMQVEAREKGTKVTEANGNVQALWDSAQRYLGDSVFLEAGVTSIDRSTGGVKVTFSTPSGQQTVTASKLIITVQPKVELLQPFLDLTQEETQLFSQFNNSYYYNAVIANVGLPFNTSIFSYDPQATDGLPALPGIYNLAFEPAVPELYSVQYSSPGPLTDEYVKSDILASVSQSRKALDLPDPEEETKIIAFNNHSPAGLTVSVDAIKSGFFKRFVDLQGQTNTFWTGRAWTSGSSSTIWNFTEVEVLPAVVAALNT